LVCLPTPGRRELCGYCVSEGGLEPVERPLDKRVSDILSAKMDPGGPGCTPLLRIGALQERTKVAPVSDPGTKVSPGCLTRAHWSWGLSSATSLWIQIAEWIDKALRWRGPDNASRVFSVFRPSARPFFAQSDRSVMKSESLEPCGVTMKASALSAAIPILGRWG
jgi:hypothetical protein